MENSDNKRSAPQRPLQNASKLNAYQINLYIYSIPKPSLWQRLLGGMKHVSR